MVGFIIFITCYFSLAFSYKIEVKEDGNMRLTSLRKTIDTHAEDIPYVEGPHLPMGFIRFRLAREKGYLFARTNDVALKAVLSAIRTANPSIKFKNLN
jgi:hypothetical protein